MHKVIKSLLAAASVFGVGASVSGTATNAEAKTFAELRQEAELACEEALRKGTVDALQEYLWKYPWANNACRALAYRAIENQGNKEGDPFKGEGNNGYNQ